MHRTRVSVCVARVIVFVCVRRAYSCVRDAFVDVCAERAFVLAWTYASPCGRFCLCARMCVIFSVCFHIFFQDNPSPIVCLMLLSEKL